MSRPMTPDQTLKAFRDEGLAVVEVPGWRSRCRCCPDAVAHRPSGPFVRAWGDVKGQLAHITAGGLGNRTVLTYIRDIINGDKATPTKSQTVIPDEKRTVYVNSAGRCNHAGKVGGSVRNHMIAADFSTADDFDNRFTGGSVDGNAFTYGDEVIAAKSMSADQRETLVMVHAARARFHGWTGQESVGHGEVSNQRGKGDPNLHMGQFRRDVMARVKAGTKPAPPTPKPTPPAPTPPSDTTLTIAYWNVGPLPYSNLKAADKARIARIVAKLKAAKCSLAVVMELHEENGTAGALGYFRSIMPKDWTVFEGDGGNQLVSMGGKYDQLTRRNYMSRNRAFTLWNLRRKSTGLPFWVNALHVTAGNSPRNILDRNTQAKDFVARTQHLARAVSAVDKNNYTASPGSPTKRLKDAGIVSIYDAPVKPVGANRNSHHDTPRRTTSTPKNIDFLGVHRLVTVNRSRQIDTTGVGGDHDLLLATVTIADD